MRHPEMRKVLYIPTLLGVAALAFLAGRKFSKHRGNLSSIVLMYVVMVSFVLLYFKYAEVEDENTTLAKNKAENSAPLVLREIAQLKDAVLRAGAQSGASAANAQTNVADENLNEAIATLAKDLAVREKESQRLHDVIIRRDHRNALARLVTIRETAEFTRKINEAGKIEDKEALSQIIQEINAAFDDLGLEVMHVSAGTRITELPNGSFTILSAEAPGNADLAGTVKEAVTEATYLRDANGKQVFIAPAKLRAYKL